MACPEFENRLLEYGELDAGERRAVDAHVSVCAACGAYREALGEVDREFERAFTAVRPQEGFDGAVLAATRQVPRLDKPSLVPMLLDFVAAAAMLLVAVLLLDNAARIVF